jgi:hypothetical protein
VMLALIGSAWDPDRLHDDDDWVRLELAEALRQTKPIIPVLIDDAQMPRSRQLPSDIRELSLIQAQRVRRDPDFEGDFTKLVNAIRNAPRLSQARLAQESAREEEKRAQAEALRSALEAQAAQLRAEETAIEQARLAAEAARHESDRRAEELAIKLAELSEQLEAERADARKKEAERVRQAQKAEAKTAAASLTNDQLLMAERAAAVETARLRAEQARIGRAAAERPKARIAPDLAEEDAAQEVPDDSSQTGEDVGIRRSAPAAEVELNGLEQIDLQRIVRPAVERLASGRIVMKRLLDDVAETSRCEELFRGIRDDLDGPAHVLLVGGDPDEAQALLERTMSADLAPDGRVAEVGPPDSPMVVTSMP